MRISDWSSDVCSSDLIGRQWLARTLARDPWEGGRMVQQYQVILMQGNASKTSETYGKAKAVEFDDTGKSLAMPVFERYPNVHEVKKIIAARRSEEHPSELQSLMRNSYAVFCLKKKTTINKT